MTTSIAHWYNESTVFGSIGAQPSHRSTIKPILYTGSAQLCFFCTVSYLFLVDVRISMLAFFAVLSTTLLRLLVYCLFLFSSLRRWSPSIPDLHSWTIASSQHLPLANRLTRHCTCTSSVRCKILRTWLRGHRTCSKHIYERSVLKLSTSFIISWMHRIGARIFIILCIGFVLMQHNDCLRLSKRTVSRECPASSAD